MRIENLIDRTIRLNARPETVFRFLTEPSYMRRWIGLRIELEPRPGARLRIDINGIDRVSGEILEIIPNRKVAFTWGWEEPEGRLAPGFSVVEITLTPDGDATILRLRHHDLRKEDYEEHEKGWKHYLDRLAIAVSGGDPGPDPMAEPTVRHGFPD